MFRKHRTPDDFAHEIDAHLAHEAERLVAEGMSPGDARDAARRAFGNPTLARARFYEASRWPVPDQLLQDLRYAARGLRKSPVFTLTAVLTLAAGLAVVSFAFAVADVYLLKEFAVREPGGLHRIAWRSPDGGGQTFDWRDYEAFGRRTDLFESVIAESSRFVSSGGRPLLVGLVSGNYFETLGPSVALGRALGQGDARAIVLSHHAWGRLFARDLSVLGRAVDVNGSAFQVVGVLAPGFTGLDDWARDAWLPLHAYTAASGVSLHAPATPVKLEMMARLSPGVSAIQAASALTPAMAEAVGQDGVRAEVRRQPSANPVSTEMIPVLSPVAAAFLLVLVTACANTSNVVLARAVGRQRETAMRLSLGASRARIVRQLLTEGLLIALLAGAAGLVLAAWCLRLALAGLMSSMPASVAALVRIPPVHVDLRVYLFALGAAALTTLLFALVPALTASKVSLTDALRGTPGRLSGSRLRNGLVLAQVTASVVLVIAALTIAANTAAVGRLELGYDPSGVTSINVRGDDASHVQRLAAVIASDPRVAESAVTGGNPLLVRTRPIAAAPEGSKAAGATRYTFVSPAYFPILRIPVVRGRSFTEQEAAAAARVAIISEQTAHEFWPGQDPIGRTIAIESPDGRPVDDLSRYPTVTVIGTVPDVVSGLLVDGRDRGHVYLPISAASPESIAMLIRPRGRDLSSQALQEIFRRAAPDPEVFEALPLQELRALQAYPLEVAASVGSLLGVLALVLSVSGLYGVLTYTLAQRSRELGIRMALGATSRAVVGLVMRQSARLSAPGLLAGTLIALAALKGLSAVIRLEQITLLAPAPFSAGVALVAAAVALAAWHPARRATRIDPAETLRDA